MSPLNLNIKSKYINKQKKLNKMHELNSFLEKPETTKDE
jgi:hypothetical protein